VLLTFGLCIGELDAQSSSEDPPLTLRVESSLVLVDVIAQQADPATRGQKLLPALKKEDFRLFDDGHEVPISSFDAGWTGTARPVSLWLIVQCDEHRPVSWASQFIKGKTQYLKPAFALMSNESQVGVAHWCDDGTAEIDSPLNHDPAPALLKLDEVLASKGDQHADDRTGQLAMQRMIRKVLSNAKDVAPMSSPVLLFLHGDHTGTLVAEAEAILRDLSTVNAMVFGLNDGGWRFDPRAVRWGPETEYLVHYYSELTGGQVYSTGDAKLYANALSYIFAQLRVRSTLGFVPASHDTQLHNLKVQLSDEAQKRLPKTTLQFRQHYRLSKSDDPTGMFD